MNTKDIDQALPGQTIWDKGYKVSIPGLHLRAFQTKKVFYLFYRTRATTQRRPKIGLYGVLTLDEARKIARDMLVDVARGGDPSLHKMQLKGELTVQELFDLTWEKHWDCEKFRSSGWASEVKRLYTKHLKKPFGTKKLSELTASIVKEWHKCFEGNVYNGNRSLEVLSKMYNYAEESEERKQHTNPCNLVKAHKEVTRERYAKSHELKKIGEILEREEATHLAEVAFIKVLLFTGARPSAIERATLDQLQIISDYGVLSYEGKNGPEKLYFTLPVLGLLSKLPADRKTLIGIKFPRYFWEKIRKEAGCTDLWARDSRRTFATVGMGSGFQMDPISEVLNHKSTQTTKLYAKLDDEHKRAVVTTTASKIEELLRGEE